MPYSYGDLRSLAHDPYPGGTGVASRCCCRRQYGINNDRVWSYCLSGRTRTSTMRSGQQGTVQSRGVRSTTGRTAGVTTNASGECVRDGVYIRKPLLHTRTEIKIFHISARRPWYQLLVLVQWDRESKLGPGEPPKGRSSCPALASRSRQRSHDYTSTTT